MMKPFALVCMLSAAGLLPAAPTAIANAVDNRSALFSADEELSAVTASRGVEGYLSFLADNAALLTGDQPVLIGKKAIRQYAKDLFAAPGHSMVWTPLRAEVASSGDLGYTWGTYESKSAQGKPASRHGKYSSIWKRQSGGEWQVVTTILTSDSGAEPSSGAGPDIEDEETPIEVVIV
jgi:ketosteroid isomerase-like protein